MIVVAILFFPHRVNERAVGLALDKKPLRDARELAKCVVGNAVWCAVADLDVFRLARWIAALEAHIADFGNGSAGGNAGKTAVAQNRGFERELRCESTANLRVGRWLAGLVVENGEGAVRALFDPVG